MSEDYDSFGDENVYYCYFHPGVEAVATCINCGKAVCADCMVDVNGQIHCKECVAAGDIVGKSPAPAQPQSAKEYDPNTVFIIELVGGFFGLLGLGYFYVGRTNDGLLRLLIWFGYNLIAWIAIVLLMAILVGFVCAVFQILIQIAIPIWSAMTLKNELERG